MLANHALVLLVGMTADGALDIPQPGLKILFDRQFSRFVKHPAIRVAHGLAQDLAAFALCLRANASELAKSIPLIKRWSAKYDWVERATLWDDYQELRRLEARIEEKKRMDERHLRIINVALQKVVAAVQKADVDALARNFNQQVLWMSELMRLERMIRGEPASIEEQRQKIEVKATTEEELRVYVPVFQELIDEGAITLDAVGIPAVSEDEEEEPPLEFEE
jgi:hypothetical protein